ncbi:hypothetical protein K501DRAFT_281492 [Backusella circina FSU 941]|nr:hypothetical protein K501DRAFT_281492 [Backusella circina FSU 941]
MGLFYFDMLSRHFSPTTTATLTKCVPFFAPLLFVLLNRPQGYGFKSSIQKYSEASKKE